MATIVALGVLLFTGAGAWFTLASDVAGKAEKSDVALLTQQVTQIAKDVEEAKATQKDMQKEQTDQGKVLARIAEKLDVD